MSNHRVAVYSRLKPEEDETLRAVPTHEPLEHNLDTKRLQKRCCMSLSAALLIAFVLWLFDPPAGHQDNADPYNTHTDLKFVVVVHRHAARSALHSYSFEKDIKWNVDPGQMLDPGFRQGFEFGRELRTKYLMSFGTGYDEYIRCFSTNFNRTIDTANSVLLGLLTDNKTNIGKPDCSCRPKDFSNSTSKCVAKCVGVAPQKLPKIEVWTEESGHDAVLRQYDVCKGRFEWVKKLQASEDYKNANDSPTFQSAFEYVKKIVGASEVCQASNKSDCHALELMDLNHIWDTAQCLAAQEGPNNGPYDNLEEVDSKLRPVTEYLWHQMYSTEIGPSIGGILLDRILSDLNKGMERIAKSKLRVTKMAPPNAGSLMVLYSAHDSTLASLLAAMNVSDWRFPVFMSHIVFELYGPDGPSEGTLDDHYVRVFYNNEPLIAGGCKEGFCSLRAFEESLEDRRRKLKNCTRVEIP